MPPPGHLAACLLETVISLALGTSAPQGSYSPAGLRPQPGPHALPGAPIASSRVSASQNQDHLMPQDPFWFWMHSSLPAQCHGQGQDWPQKSCHPISSLRPSPSLCPDIGPVLSRLLHRVWSLMERPCGGLGWGGRGHTCPGNGRPTSGFPGRAEECSGQSELVLGSNRSSSALWPRVSVLSLCASVSSSVQQGS